MSDHCRCPHCDEYIYIDDVYCPHCGERVIVVNLDKKKR